MLFSEVFLKSKIRPKRYQSSKREAGGVVRHNIFKEEVEGRGRQEWKMKDMTWKPSFFTIFLSKIGWREKSIGKDKKGEWVEWMIYWYYIFPCYLSHHASNSKTYLHCVLNRDASERNKSLLTFEMLTEKLRKWRGFLDAKSNPLQINKDPEINRDFKS